MWEYLRGIGSIRQRECRWRNRRGQVFTILLSAETIKVNDAAHVLSMALDTFCRRVVDEVLSATSRRCPIELSLASALPQAHADERLLQHILTNLLSNAVKYSEPGACVRFVVERDAAAAVCVIRDEGIGISE